MERVLGAEMEDRGAAEGLTILAAESPLAVHLVIGDGGVVGNVGAGGVEGGRDTSWCCPHAA